MYVMMFHFLFIFFLTFFLNFIWWFKKTDSKLKQLFTKNSSSDFFITFFFQRNVWLSVICSFKTWNLNVSQKFSHDDFLWRLVYQLFCSYILPQKDMVLYFCEEEVAFLKVILSSFWQLKSRMIANSSEFFQHTCILLDPSKHKILQLNKSIHSLKPKWKKNVLPKVLGTKMLQGKSKCGDFTQN